MQFIFLRKNIFFLSLLFVAASAKAQNSCPVIPLPNRYTEHPGSFDLSSISSIGAKDVQGKFLVHYFMNKLDSLTGIKIKERKSKAANIVLQLNNAHSDSNDESYVLKMSDEKVIITSSSAHGLFNGVNSLLQIALSAPKVNGKLALSSWDIEDTPARAWRGFMMDESRHFFGKQIIKQLLDEMAFYKLNRFNWHLTDEPAWRMEIKKYPNLTETGSAGDYEHRHGPKQYYTQEDIREIVAYAAQRFITVIPEVDMPGHATAANRSYPQFSGGGTVQHPEFTFNPGLDSTYTYLTDILKEVAALFPSKIIHIGGDEVSYGNQKWSTDAHISELMSKEHLATLTDVEHYFIRRMADSVAKIGCTVAGWDEVASSGVPNNNTLIYWWRQDHPEQLKYAIDKGYRVILSPRLPFYFDFVQRPQDRQGRRWDTEFNTIKDVYDFNADSIATSKNIIGYQVALWTEQVRSVDRLYYMLFPRILAFAEAAWTNDDKKNFEDFNRRIDVDFSYWLSRNRPFCNYKDASQKEITDKITPVKYLDNKAKN